MKLGQGNIFTSVCLSTGEGLPQCMLGYPPPWSRHPPRSRHPEPPQTRHHPPPGPGRPPQTRQTPPDQVPPQEQTPPGADTPTPTPPLPPGSDCSIRLMSSRYASYWNAFLLNISYTVNMVGINTLRWPMEHDTFRETK